MANIKDGGDLMVFLGTDTLAMATSHKLSVNVETVENSSKDNGNGKWQSKTAKRMSWSVTSDNLFVEKGDTMKKQKAFGDLFDLMIKRQPVELVFASASNGEVDDIPSSGWTAAATGTYTGSAIITSLEANAANGDNATYSVSFEGVGALAHAAEA